MSDQIEELRTECRMWTQGQIIRALRDKIVRHLDAAGPNAVAIERTDYGPLLDELERRAKEKLERLG